MATVLRHRQRHVHATIVAHVNEILTGFGWKSSPAPFRTTPVTVLDYEPQKAGITPQANTVAVSIDEEGEDVAFELGGGVYTCPYTTFIDIYPASEPVGIALAGDLKHELTEGIIPLRDFTSDPDGEVVDAQIEFEHTLVEIPPIATTSVDKRNWRVVKTTAVCYF